MLCLEILGHEIAELLYSRCGAEPAGTLVDFQLCISIGADTTKDVFGNDAMHFDSLLVFLKKRSLLLIGLMTIKCAMGIVIVIFCAKVVKALLSLRTLAN